MLVICIKDEALNQINDEGLEHISKLKSLAILHLRILLDRSVLN
jgi:hypothetical protein